MRSHRFTVVLLGAVLVCPAAAMAQVADSFVELSTRVRDGDRISLRDDQGFEVQGRFIALSPTSLSVLVDGESRNFPIRTINEVWRRGDSVKNGLAFGILGGALAGGFMGPRNRGEEFAFFLPGALLGSLVGAGVGAAVDALIPGKQLVYRAREDLTAHVLVAPHVDRTGAGVFGTVRF